MFVECFHVQTGNTKDCEKDTSEFLNHPSLDNRLGALCGWNKGQATSSWLIFFREVQIKDYWIINLVHNTVCGEVNKFSLT